MNNYYFTFGQVHTHSVNGKTFDKDCVVSIKAGSSDSARRKMFDTFGQKWASQYETQPDMRFYPGGIITL